MNNANDHPTGLFLLENKPYELASTLKWTEGAGYLIIGPAYDKQSAIKLVKKEIKNISLALIDLIIPESKTEQKEDPVFGLEVALALHKHNVPIVIFSKMVYPDILLVAIANKFSYLQKYDLEGDAGLIQALESTLLGSAVYSKSVLQEIHRMIKAQSEDSPLDKLEKRILKLVINNLNDQQIGDELGYSASSIRKRKPIILKKIGVSNWIEADRWARENPNKLR